MHRRLLVAALTLLPTVLVAQAPAAGSGSPKMLSSADGKFMVRVRGLGWRTGDQSDAVPLLGLRADQIATSDEALAELEVSYFVTPRLSLSVSGGTPVTHDAFINGSTIGTFKQTPLSARALLHLWPTARLRPYVGAGIVVAPISDVNLVAAGVGRFALETPAVGPVGQVGADIQLTKRLFLNADVRYALVGVTLNAGVNPVSNLGLNPLTFGGGIGVRF